MVFVKPVTVQRCLRGRTCVFMPRDRVLAKNAHYVPHEFLDLETTRASEEVIMYWHRKRR